MTNVEIWYGLNNTEIKQLEDLDLNLLRRFLNTPFSVPSEAVYLELGCLNISTIIKSRRLNYLHYLVKQDEASMLYQVFITQWKYPAEKNEWTEQAKKDLADFDLPVDLSTIKNMPKYTFKQLIKRKSKEFAFMSYLEKKEKHSKLENLFYCDLKMQSYLNEEGINKVEKQTLFSYRCRMANYGENFRGKNNTTICPLCENHPDSQKWAFQCKHIKENVNIQGKYSNIFSDSITKETVKTFCEIIQFRTEYLEQRKIK